MLGQFVSQQCIYSTETNVQQMLAQTSPHNVSEQRNTVIRKETPTFSHFDSPGQDGQEDKESQEEAGHMMADFNALWEEAGKDQEMLNSTSDGDGFDSRNEGVESSEEEETSVAEVVYPNSGDVPNTPSTILSSDQVQTPTADDDDDQPLAGESGEGSEVKHHHGSDVEDGELSDSSGEVNKINSQEVCIL